MKDLNAKHYFHLITLLVVLGFSVPSAGQSASPCEDRQELHLLDFWVGTWDVYVNDQQVGTNTIEKILGGCALIENWRDGRGNEGKSLFYYYPQEERWKQVWVTGNPFRTGGVKEKSHVETLDNGGTLFQGTVIAADGTEYLDRTTLRPLEAGDVEQVIEISVDGGETWKAMFRGLYKRAEE